MLKKYISVLALILLTAHLAHARRIPKVVNPDCMDEWTKKLQNESAVRFGFEFLDKDGKPLSKEDMDNKPNPAGYCSGNVVHVPPDNKTKFVSAAHCARDQFRAAANGIYQKPANPDPNNPLDKAMPPKAASMRIVARIGSNMEWTPITSFNGPKVITDTSDHSETFRKNDYVIMDTVAKKLDEMMAGKEVPDLCDPAMTKDDIEKAAVIGYGKTNVQNPTNGPLCAYQNISSIQDGIITIDSYHRGSGGACPGDSGGGLWVKPKHGGKVCLAGTVAGPRTGSGTGTLLPGALGGCTQEGVQAIFASVYQQLAPVSPQSTETTSERTIQH